MFTNLLEFYGTPQTRLEYRIRHFAAGDGIGLMRQIWYVNATGDTMTGVLTLKQKGNSHILKINTSDEVQALNYIATVMAQTFAPTFTLIRTSSLLPMEANFSRFMAAVKRFLVDWLIRLVTPTQHTKNTLMTQSLASAVATPAICHCLAAR